jgi:hypothetical protein
MLVAWRWIGGYLFVFHCKEVKEGGPLLMSGICNLHLVGDPQGDSCLLMVNRNTNFLKPQKWTPTSANQGLKS